MAKEKLSLFSYKHDAREMYEEVEVQLHKTYPRHLRAECVCMSLAEEPVMFKDRQQLLHRIQKTQSIMTEGNKHDFNIFSVHRVTLPAYRETNR